MASPYKLKNAALLMALAAAYPLQAYAAAGTTLFTSGEVSVRRGTNADALAKGGNVESGDTILTGAQGRAQLRFSDGGLVALQPNSQFNISKYADANDPKQDAFLVDLLRGGMRAVTGLIGKRNRENYKVTTSTATIGIRGSSFLMSYQPDGTLVVSTEQDAIEVCTKAGCTGLTAGESVRVVSADREPVRTSTRASIPVPSPTRDPVIVGDSTKGTGSNGIVPNAPAQSPSPSPSPSPAPATSKLLTGMAFVSAGLNGSNALNQRQYSTGGLEVDAATGKPIKYQGSNNDVVTSTAPVNVVATSGSLATGDLLILGTWANSAWAQGSGGVGAGTPASTLTNTGFATGVPTPTGALSSLSGTRGTYALASATPVYSSQGAVGTVLSTSKLTVDFLGAGVYADLNIDLRMPALTETSRTLNVNNNVPVVQTGSTTDFNLRGGVTGTGSGFAGGLYVSSPACVSTLNNCGVGSFNGFVSGPNAANAGVSYKAGSNTVYGNFGGAATFAQSSSAATAAQNLSDGLNSTISSSMTVRFASPTYFREGGFDSYAAGPPAVYGSYTPGAQTGTSFQAGEGTSINFQGSQFVGVVNTGSQGTLAKATGTSSNFGAVGVPTDSDFIGWGAWAQGRGTNPTASGSGGSGGTGFGGNGSGTSQLIDWVHYIAGTPTPTNQMPVAGTATYGLVGGSTPTAYLNGVTQTGQLVSGTLNVDFGTSKIGVSIATQFGANTVNINVAQAAGNTYNGSAISYYSGGNTFNTNSCGPTQINGFFTGNLAYRAGLVYRTVDSAVGVVNGAAAFQRTSGSGLSTPCVTSCGGGGG